MNEKYVVDTTALISYFDEIFGGSPQISEEALDIIDKAFNDTSSAILIFPSIIFIEVFKKFFVTEEAAEKIKIEVFYRIINSPNMEVKPFEREVLEAFISIKDIEPKYNFENHDKQVLASAMMLNCPLITSDKRIIRYNKRKNVVPKVIT
ncbi:MAG: PIN domain-containing protein [Bacteroidota bacterium]